MRASWCRGVVGFCSLVVPACGGHTEISNTLPGGFQGAEGGLDSRGEPGSAGGVDPDDTGDRSTGGAANSGGGAGGSSAPTPTGGNREAGGNTPSAGSTATGGASPNGGFATSGGAAPGGRASAGGAPPLRECTLTAPVAPPAQDPDSCELQLMCPANNYVSMACSKLGSGTWGCECAGTQGPRQYEVNGLTGAAVCEAAAHLCAFGEAPTANGPKECATTYATRGPESCELKWSCVHPMTAPGQVEATITTLDEVWCKTDPATGIYCGCDLGRYQVAGQDGTEACDTMRDICAADSPVGFGSEGSCTRSPDRPFPGFIGRDGCSVGQVCHRVADLGNGVSVTSAEQGELACATKSSGNGSNCSCMNENGSVRFEIASPTNDDGTCEHHLPLCRDFDSVELTGEITCAPVGQGVVGDYCGVSLDCKQPAIASGEQIFVYGSLNIDCSAAGNEYYCNCVAYDDSAQIEVPASNAWDACTAALAECPNAVSVKIGDGAGVIQSPDPGAI